MNEIMQYIFNLGAAVLLPIVIFIIGLCVGTKPGKAFQSGLMVGIGFVGIGLVIGLMLNNLGPAADAMAKNLGLNLNVVDVGWPGASPMTWKTPIAAVAIPIAIVVNLIMLFTRMTKVINIDIWNIWHMAFTGAIVHVATGNFTYAMVGVAVHAAIAYKFGDWFRHETKDFFELEGIAVPHGTSAYNGPFAVLVDTIIEKIPGLNKISFTANDMAHKMGIFGQPIIIGLFLGILIGILAGYDAKSVIQLGVDMAAVMYMMPLVVKPIMNGLLPISEAAKTRLSKVMGDEAGFTLGMDPALLLGETSVVTASLFFVPLTLLIAILIPGNRVLPFGDLATIGFFVAMAVAVHKGNLFRTLISGSIIMAINIWIANQTIDWHTKMAQDVGVVQPGSLVASLDQGGAPITYIFTQLLTFQNVAGLAVIGAIYGVAVFITWRRCKVLDKVNG
ncbi:MAG: PTS galactitol transporter subunit IIC [Brevinema sp.]